MASDTNWNCFLKCFFPGCNRLVPDKYLNAGRGTCSPECSKRFKAKYGQKTLTDCEKYMLDIAYGSRQKRLYDQYKKALKLDPPLRRSLEEQIKARIALREELRSKATTPAGKRARLEVMRILSAGRITCESDLRWELTDDEAAMVMDEGLNPYS